MLMDILTPCWSNLWSITILLILVYFWQSKRSRANLPPFPSTPLPVVGNLLSLETNPRHLLEKWRQKHGDVFSMYMGQTLVIFFNGYDAVKEALVTYGDHFSDRPVFFMDMAVNSINCGIVTSSGAVWEEQRALTVNILRELGVGKNIMGEKIQEEIGYFMQDLEKMKNQPVDISSNIYLAVSNIICNIVIGERQSYEDPKFHLLIDNMSWIAKKIQMTNPLHFFPKLMYIPGDIFNGKEIQRRMSQVIELFAEHFIRENEADDSGENFIAMFLRHCRLNRERGVNSTLDKKKLSKTIFELLAAGSETSSTTIWWFILFLLHNPTIQEKIQEEIDSHIGSNRLPNINDKPRLPLLNASIMETQRLSSVVPLAITHLCNKTVQFRGYTIPKDASIAPNIDSVLFDKKTWGDDADIFRPERHLDQSGNLITRPEFIPFSLGKRYCLGDILAKMELFFFTTSMMQKYTFLPEDPNNLPTTEGIFGLTCNPQPFKVKIIAREQRT